MNKKICEMITQQIIEQLEKGNVPWQKPWSGLERPVNWKTGKEYRGVNLLLLPPGEYATFKQVQEAGGRVKKDSKAYTVVFWKIINKEVEYKGVDGEVEKDVETFPVLRYYKVFNVIEQCEGLELRWTEKNKNKIVVEGIHEKLINDYIKNEGIQFINGDRAYYNRVDDLICLPNKDRFFNSDGYKLTAYHEIVHSTGHEKRLNRECMKEVRVWGDDKYALEELVAELGANFICAQLGMDNVKQNSISYIRGWLKALKDNPTWIIRANSMAQKACDYVFKSAGVEVNEHENESEKVGA